MVDAQALATRHHRAGVALRRRAEREATRAWRRLERNRLDLSWLTAVPGLIATVTVAQAAAAAAADDYTQTVLQAQGIDPAPAGVVVPGAFAGEASDGRRLDTLLYQPVVATKTAIARGASTVRAMAAGLTHLQLIVGTQVADAGRAADGVAITTRPQVGGYVRMLSLPSCSRCVILAGRWYRWNAGFQRHPRCDCRHIPTAENLAADLTTDPRAAVEAGRVTGLSKAETQAIADGANPAAVVNARRGMYTAAGRRLTREAAGRSLRPRPEQIYRDATSRDDAIRLLSRFGYIR